MSLYKKKNNSKPVGRSWVKLVNIVKELKEKQLLTTTDQGVFFVYKGLFFKNSETVFAKNLFTYALMAKLLKSSTETLYFKDLETNNLFAQYDLKNGFVPIL